MRSFSKEWLKAANDDLLTIEEIIHVEHLTHIVAFHSQHAIEKSLKAIAEEYELDIPKIHSLTRLHTLLDSKIEIENYALLHLLDKLYIDSRYPGELGLLPDGKPTHEDAKEFFEFAQKIFYDVCKKLEIDPKELT
jgi:HEPN domain-containing protein